jgi:UDP-N-acetylmuramoyl-tripeptide--D-alanyl-D-alanine ligase
MFTVKEIIQATKGKLVQGNKAISVESVSIDSRQAKEGQLFIAIKGETFDGHNFINEVIAKGIRTIVIHKPVKVKDPKAVVIQVKDTTKALGHLARFHRLRFKIPVVALTGSAGKTTTKEMLGAVLGQKYQVLKSEGTQNNHIGVPLTLLKLNSSYQIVVLECGTNQPGDIAWLADIGRPTVALFTNIGESHLEKLKTPQGVLREKWNLTKYMDSKGIVILNQDDALLKKAASRFKGRTIGFSLFSPERKKLPSRFSSTDRCANALAAWACGRLFKVTPQAIYSALDHFKFPPGREEVIDLKDRWLINDTYNANPVSMRSAIEMLNTFPSAQRRIFVAADMLELGTQAKRLHESIGETIACSKINMLVTVGKLAKHIALQAKKKTKMILVFTYNDIEPAVMELTRTFRSGDVVLVKGSRGMKMERLVERLRG